MAGFIYSIRRMTAPALARVFAQLSRASWTPPGFKLRLWELAQTYLFFFDVRAISRSRFGMTFETGTASMVEKQIFFFGEWEPLFTRYLTGKQQREGTFLDIGANIGYFSLLASQKFERVCAIEASPTVYARLRENITRNGASNVHPIHVGLGEKEGVAVFYKDPRQSGGSSFLPGQGREPESEVRLAPLDAIFSPEDLSQVKFIKIDIEGFDHFAMEQIIECRDMLPKDVEIFVEYHPRSDARLWAAVQALVVEGYTAYTIQGTYDISDYTYRQRQCNPERVTKEPTQSCDILLTRKLKY